MSPLRSCGVVVRVAKKEKEEDGPLTSGVVCVSNACGEGEDDERRCKGGLDEGNRDGQGLKRVAKPWPTPPSARDRGPVAPDGTGKSTHRVHSFLNVRGLLLLVGQR